MSARNIVCIFYCVYVLLCIVSCALFACIVSSVLFVCVTSGVYCMFNVSQSMNIVSILNVPIYAHGIRFIFQDRSILINK